MESNPEDVPVGHVRFISNRILDTKITYVTEVVHKRSNRNHDKLEERLNPFSLLQSFNTRRIKTVAT